MNINKADEVLHGLITNPDETTDGPFYTGGPSSPVGLDLPERTFYLQNISGGVLIWRKFGVGNNDWRQLSAEDLPYAPVGLNFDPADTDVKKALDRIGGFSVTDLTQAEGFTDSAQENTSSDDWVSKTNFPIVTVNEKTAGKFSLRWSANVGQTKNGRNFGFRVLWRPTGGVFAVLSSVQLSVSNDGSVLMQSGFKEVDLLADSTIEMDIQHGQTTDGFESIIKDVSVEVRRIGN